MLKIKTYSLVGALVGTLLPVLSHSAEFVKPLTEGAGHEARNRPVSPGNVGVADLGKSVDRAGKLLSSSCLAKTELDFSASATPSSAEVMKVQPLPAVPQILESLGFLTTERSVLALQDGSPSAQFARLLLAEDSSLVYAFGISLPPETVSLKAVELATEARKQITKKALKGGFQGFYARCGEEFVERVELGAQLFFAIRFDLKNRDQKTTLQRYLGSTPGLGRLQDAVRQASTLLANDGIIQVAALQWGADTDAFLRAHQPARGMTGPASSVQTVCAAGRSVSCSTLLTNILIYAEGARGFASQISHPDRVPLRAATRLWGTAVPELLKAPAAMGPPAPINPSSGPSADAPKKALGEAFRALVTSKVRLDIMREGFQLSESQRTLFARAEGYLKTALSYLPTTAAECYRDDSRCAALSGYIVGQLNQLANQTGFSARNLSIEPQGFSLWCEAAGHGRDRFGSLFPRDITVEAARTVDAIIAASEVLTGPDRCEAVRSRFSTPMAVLALDGIELKDLRPLFSFASLERLSLTRMKLSSLQGLGAMSQLRYLNLSNNEIRDVSDLAQLATLYSLDLSHNPVTEVQALSRLPALEVLKLGFTPAAEKRLCPIKSGGCAF